LRENVAGFLWAQPESIMCTFGDPEFIQEAYPDARCYNRAKHHLPTSAEVMRSRDVAV
jgi:hypothetical protein